MLSPVQCEGPRVTLPSPQARDILSFGPFQLIANERLLLREGAPVELGGRALDILTVLVAHPNEPISKSDLLAKVWPDVTVDEGSLRFHIAGLRKALGDGKDGARYITTLAGRGYCFVAPVTRAGNPATAAKASPVRPPDANLPNRLTRMVGRTDDIKAIASQLANNRFVTIVGSGGVGKTTVALAVAHERLASFPDGALFVDFGAMSDPKLTGPSVAAMLGLTVQSDDALPSLLAFLRDKRILLVFDNCEHLIDAVANIAERIFAAAPHAHILATSREPLRIEGEHVYRLEPLACPPDDVKLTAETARSFPATQLFLERAAASGAHIELNDQDAALIADICRKLDGVALAIELAAGRVEANGLQQTATLLEQRLGFLWQGQRTAPPRQKTLQATLDWSYSLLNDVERIVLRRLAVFVGHFTIDAALAVVTGERIERAQVFGAIDSLVAKSMVATRPFGAMMRYRLLDTTRSYALGLALDAADLTALARRHAAYFQDWLEQASGDIPAHQSVARSIHLIAIANVRAALQWAFAPNGDAAAGVRLAAAAGPIFLALSLLTDCHRWSERALAALDDTTRNSGAEMRLQAALAMSLMFSRGDHDSARKALTKALAIAETKGNARDRLLILAPLHTSHFRAGEYKTALQYAHRALTVAADIDDPAAISLAQALLGISLHKSGDLDGARVQLVGAVKHGAAGLRLGTAYLGFNGASLASIVLARTLWLQGYPDQARELAQRTVREAEDLGHPVTLSIALIWSISVLIWRGDLAAADKQIDLFIARAGEHSMTPYLVVGRALKAELAIRTGDVKTGVDALRQALHEMQAARYEVLTSWFSITLAKGLIDATQFTPGLALVDETIARVTANGDGTALPELLRMKGVLLWLRPAPDLDAAERGLRESLALAQQQSARSFQLRTATDLAKLMAQRRKAKAARDLLQPVLAQFTEGLDTADLVAARQVLADLR